jgi:hypothetical protein
MTKPVLASVGDDGVLNAKLPLSLSEVWIDRDASWLDFNERVLAEALDSRTPLIERAKFFGDLHLQSGRILYEARSRSQTVDFETNRSGHTSLGARAQTETVDDSRYLPARHTTGVGIGGGW